MKKLGESGSGQKLFAQLRRGILPMMSANILNNIVNMLSNMIITRILTKSEYGIWSYTLNIYSYLNLITGLGLLSGAFQFGAENRGQEKEFQYYKFCLKTGLLINSILVLVFWGITIFVPFALPEASPFIRTIAPIILLEYIFQLLQTILRCQERIKDYARDLNVNTILSVLGNCVGALFGVWGVVVGRYLAVLLSVIFVGRKTWKEIWKINGSKILKYREIKSLWHYSLFTGTCSALNNLLYLLDVSMIASLLHNSEQVAVYKMATLIPTALYFIPNSIVICVLPEIIRNNKNSAWLRENVAKYYLYLGGLNIVLGILLIILAPLIITILSGTQYLGGVPVFRILACGYVVAGTFRSLSTNILVGLRCVNYNLFLSIVSGVCDIIFNYFCIQQFGMVGAAYATLGVDIIASVLAFGYLFKKVYI